MKRKRSTTSSNHDRKRQKGRAHPHSSFDPNKLYEIESIVGENETKYQINWKDDPVTGEQYPVSWEPKRNANSEAIEDWEYQKAEKRRLEKLIAGQESRSRSSSSNTQQVKAPRKSAATPRRKGRPRRVIDSSSQPAESSHTNGGIDEQLHDHPEDFLEIDESPPPSLPQVTDAASPLFEPEEGDEHASPGQSDGAVHLSPPPSSYLAGGYQAISTQAQSGARNSPEPSQYLPDPGDTSTTTANTTEISIAPSTPTQRVQSVPVSFGLSSVNIVPDSQSVPGSASYVPSAAVTSSSSAPETRQFEQGNPATFTNTTTEVETSTAPIQNSQIQDRIRISDLLPTGVVIEEDTSVVGVENHPEKEAAENIGYQQGSGAQTERGSSEFQKHEPQQTSSQALFAVEPQRPANLPPSPDRTSLPAEAPTTVENAINVEQAENRLPLPNEVLGDSRGELRSRAQDADIPEKNVTPSPQVREQHSHFEGQIGPASQLVENQDDSSALINHTSQHHSVSQSGATGNDQTTLEELERSNSQLQPVNSTSPVQPESNSATKAQIDLTNTQNQTGLSGFSITPPQHRPLQPFGNRQFPQQQLESSAWQSSPFLFQTQLPRTQTHATTNSTSNSPQSNSGAQQPLEQAGTLRETARSSPGVASQPVLHRPIQFSQSSPRLASSQPVGGHVFGESAPLHSKLPSSPIRPPSQDSTMEQSQPPASLVARLAATRQAAKERRAAQRSATPSSAPPSEASKTNSPTTVFKPDAAPVVQPAATPKLASPFLMPDDRVRSPSLVPALEPLPVITRDEMNTSRRFETLLPQSQDRSEQSHQNGSLTGTGTPERQKSLEQDPEAANVHVVPIYLIGHQRDHYPEVVYHHRQLIDQYLESDAPDGILVREAKAFVERVRRVVLHPDLDNVETAYSQYDVPASQQAKWDVDCSAKFRFLKDLLDSVRNSKLHIVLVVQPGRIVDILETFLQGIRISYSRVGANKPVVQDDVDGVVHVSLTATDTEGSLQHADLIIAMDNSVKYGSERIRAARLQDGRWAPFITLVVPRSVEHIERSLSPTLSDRTRTRALVSGIKQHSDKAGKTMDGQSIPKDTARLIAQHLTNVELNGEWPLPPLANLEDLDSQTDSEIDIVVSNADASALVVGREKRLRELDEDADDSEPQKRSRVESPATGAAPDTSTNPQDLDTTHISDSITKASQDAESSSLSLTSNEKRLQDLLVAVQDQLEDYKRDLGELQYRHEDQRKRLVDVTVERDNAIETATKALNRLGEESNKMSSLRTENSSLKEQLSQANAKLLDHSVPERVELESLRQQLAQATAKEEKAERRMEQASKDVAYVRELYQNSSNSAQSLSVQVNELENQLSVAQNKATGEQVKLRSLGYDSFTKSLQDENKKLKVMLKERDAGLKFRDEEIAKLKEASRGRMGTRGTSVPRSPRMGSPRIGSRQTSPAAGELRGRNALLHPLRNAES